MTNNIPEKSSKLKTKPKWFSNDVKINISRKKEAWRSFQRNQSSDSLEHYKETEVNLKRSIRDAKCKYEKDLVDNFKQNPRNFFAYASKKQKSSTVGPMLIDNNLVQNDLEIVEELNSFFVSVFTAEKPDNLPNIPVNNIEHLTDIFIAPDVILKKLSTLKDYKAPGPDNIYPKLLKECAQQLCVPLSIIFRKSIDEGIVFRQWKLANITPLFKKGAKNLVQNYRPISLTSVPCKILESLIKEQLVEHLEKFNIIKNTQHGFRKGKSCLTNLLEYLEYITDQIDQGNPVDSILLDFSKAFDKVPHTRLLLKLKSVGISGKILLWIEQWLTGRKQSVVLNNVISKWRPVLSGVPQGSVLGPILFLIYINDIDDCVSSKISKFADDTKLFHKVSDLEDNDRLQSDLQRLTEWANVWQMEFNASKCKVLHFGNSNRSFSYNINSVSLEATNSEKDLGVYISNDLKPEKHINEVVLKANRLLGMIYRSIEIKSKDIIVPLYCSLVRPHLEYCIQAWRPYYVKDISKIEKVQRRALNMIEGLNGLSYHAKLQAVGLDTLEIRRIKSDMIEVFKELINCDTSGTSLFEYDVNRINLRGHSRKLKGKPFRTEIRRHSFSQRIINTWNSLPECVVSSPTIEIFKDRLTQHFKNAYT